MKGEKWLGAQDAFVTPLVALLLLLIFAGMLALLYKTWLLILPYLEPMQVTLARHRNSGRKPKYAPRPERNVCLLYEHTS